MEILTGEGVALAEVGESWAGPPGHETSPTLVISGVAIFALGSRRARHVDPAAGGEARAVPVEYFLGLCDDADVEPQG